MRSVIKYLFTRHAPKQFIGVKILPGEINEKVILKVGDNKIDITERHCIVCQTPMHIAVSFPFNQFKLSGSDHFETLIINNKQKLSVTKLVLVHKIIAEGVEIFLFKAIEGSYFKLNVLFQNHLLMRFKNNDKHTLPELRIQLALYCYPRNINIISFKNDTYYNIFPMNFQRYMEDSKLHFFGLRTTNITLDKILEEKKIVVSNPGDAGFDTIYSLGSHNSKSPPPIAHLPFATTESEVFKFPVPAFATSYSEIEIISNYLLGSHMFFVGKVINKKEIKEKTVSAYNIHLFPFQHSKYKEEG